MHRTISLFWLANVRAASFSSQANTSVGSLTSICVVSSLLKFVMILNLGGKHFVYRRYLSEKPEYASPPLQFSEIPVKLPSWRTGSIFPKSTLSDVYAMGAGYFALLTGRWRTLHHVTASPGKTGDIVVAMTGLLGFRAMEHCDALGEYFSVPAVSTILERFGDYTMEQLDHLFTATSIVEDLSMGTSVLEG
jgi:hypothetical protein